MDYTRLNRRELQVLCKEHGIPANKTNAFMAEALGALLNAPKEDHQEMGESITDPAEVVKSRAKKAVKSKKVDDVAAVEVDDLASHLAQSTITCDSSSLGMLEPAGGTVADAIIGDPEEIDNAAEAGKVRRKPRTQTSRRGGKTNSIEADAAEDVFTNSDFIVESPLEVLPTTDVPSTAVEEMEHEPVAPILSQKYSRREAKKQESDAAHYWSSTMVAEADTAAILPESTLSVQNYASVEPIAVEEAMGGAKSLAKKSKSKGKKPTKSKPTSPAAAPAPEDGFPTLGGEIVLSDALGSLGSTPMDEDLPLPSFVETISQIPPLHVLEQYQYEEEVPLATKSKGKGKKTTKMQPITSPSTADTSEESSTGAEEADNVLLAALKSISPTTETFLVAKTSRVKVIKGKKSSKMQPTSPSPVDTSEDGSTVAEKADYVLDAALKSLSPATETFLCDQILPGEATVRAKPLVKKSKTKVKRVTKVKTLVATAQNPQNELVPTPTDDDSSLTADVNSREVFQAAESPAFGLALGSDTTEDMLFATRLSPAAEDEDFEFHPVPSSLNEILSQTQPEDPVGLEMKGCQHRAGRKSGLACTSCASERKVASVMQDVLQSMDNPEVHRGEDVLQENISSVDEFRKTTVKSEVITTTPVKEGDDKENSLKKIDLHSLSIRKLQKEVQKRGLSKRSNTRSTKIH